MPGKSPPVKDYEQIAASATVLGSEGSELKKGIWETGVYLGADGYVYHLTASKAADQLKVSVAGKRSVGEYLRWVDGLFRPGEIPGESSAVHYRAARKLREII
jgi:hypothetical protein